MFVYSFVHLFLSAYVNTCVCIYIYICTHTDKEADDVYIRMLMCHHVQSKHVYICTNTCVYVPVCIHMYT